MANNHIPNGFTSVTPYLIVRNASGLLDFIKNVFDAEESFCMRRDDGTVAHASVRLGNGMIELSEAQGEWQPMPGALHIYMEDPDAHYRRAIEAGATSLYEPTDHFYGERSGGVLDAFGNHWYIARHLEEVSVEELKERAAAMKEG